MDATKLPQMRTTGYTNTSEGDFRWSRPICGHRCDTLFLSHPRSQSTGQSRMALYCSDLHYRYSFEWGVQSGTSRTVVLLILHDCFQATHDLSRLNAECRSSNHRYCHLPLCHHAINLRPGEPHHLQAEAEALHHRERPPSPWSTGTSIRHHQLALGIGSNVRRALQYCTAIIVVVLAVTIIVIRLGKMWKYNRVCKGAIAEDNAIFMVSFNYDLRDHVDGREG